MKQKWLALSLCATLTLSTLNGCGAASHSNGDSPAPSILSATMSSASAANEAVPRTAATVDLTGATTIAFSGTTAQIEGSGASVENGVVTITGGGTCVLSGTLSEGRILVNAPDKAVVLVFNGASITCSYGSPVYIYASDLTTVHLMEGTENQLADGTTYTFADSLSSAADEEPNACLYSKSDLRIQGAGALTVQANYKSGVTSKDTLEVYDLTLAVTAVHNGINGKDSNTIDSTHITVDCGGDAICASNDTDSTLGWITVSNSTLTLTAGEDGIQAETVATVSSGSYAIVSGGGNTVTPGEEISAKGIKGGTAVQLTSGYYDLDCSDDAIHSNGDVTLSGGVYTISTGDDAIHADSTSTVSGGEIDVLTSYEGLEGTDVAVSGGSLRIVSTDDGINAAGGADGSGFGGHGPGNTFAPSDSSHGITISGGTVVVNAGGDGLDANGSLTMTGGTALVFSTGNADGALDYDGTFTLEGGTLLAAGSGNMAQAPSDPTQYTAFLNFGSTLEAGTYVQLAGTNGDFVFELVTAASNLLFSSPDLVSGATYSVSHGGSYTGESNNGLCSGGTYDGGTVLTELTLSDFLTTYGQTGMSGGLRGGGGGVRPDDDGTHPAGRGNRPTDGGTPPELPTDGTKPADGTAPAAPDGTAPADDKPGTAPDTVPLT